MSRNLMFLGGFAFVAAVVLVGCNKTPDEKVAVVPSVDSKKGTGGKASDHAEDEHSHKAGAHGGLIVSLGKDSYHAEAVFEKGRKVRLFMLGKEETRVQEVDVQDLTAFVTVEGTTDAVSVPFQSEPQAGDGKGKTSQFAAILPADTAGKKVQITINNLVVNGERFRISFGNEVLAHADQMPVKKTTEEEGKLFFAPGGIYTSADIRTNGNTIPAVKYNGIRPTHDSRPKPGQKVCPISETVSNPKFTWVVGGKTYEFCCVPCIEEFVATAKDKPDEIKDPAEYVKK